MPDEEKIHERDCFWLITPDNSTSKNIQRLITLNGWKLRVTIGLYERDENGSVQARYDEKGKLIRDAEGRMVPKIKEIVSMKDGVSMAYVRIEEVL